MKKPHTGHRRCPRRKNSWSMIDYSWRRRQVLKRHQSVSCAAVRKWRLTFVEFCRTMPAREGSLQLAGRPPPRSSVMAHWLYDWCSSVSNTTWNIATSSCRDGYIRPRVAPCFSIVQPSTQFGMNCRMWEVKRRSGRRRKRKFIICTLHFIQWRMWPDGHDPLILQTPKWERRYHIFPDCIRLVVLVSMTMKNIMGLLSVTEPLNYYHHGISM